MTTSPVVELVGVYDADGTIAGEIRYWLGARIGTAHCSLCEVTHGLFTQRSEWREWRTSLEIPFNLFHRNDMPEEVAKASSELPMVAARTADGIMILLGPTELDRCDGDLRTFLEVLDAALDSAGLRLGNR
jgi:hypothetical protein